MPITIVPAKQEDFFGKKVKTRFSVACSFSINDSYFINSQRAKRTRKKFWNFYT